MRNVKPYQWSFCLLKTYVTFWNPSLIFMTMHRTVGKYRFTELSNSYKCWHILFYNMKKTTFVNTCPISSEKPLTIKKLSSSQWWIQVVLNSNTYLKAQILSLAINIVICFPWNDSFTVHLWDNICQIPKFV